MRSRAAATLALGLVVAGALAGCVGGGATPAAPGTTAAASPTTAAVTTTTGPARPVTLADAKDCRTTIPEAGGPPGVTAAQFFGYGASHGNGKLWVGGLWPGGVIDAGPEFVQPDGSVDMKFGWWRVVPGKLRITGRRLDAPAPPLRGLAPDGYGDRGFQASGVMFPTEGCWEVTGDLGVTSLTFVTFVVKKAA
jgi:hypothetical protein